MDSYEFWISERDLYLPPEDRMKTDEDGNEIEEPEEEGWYDNYEDILIERSERE